MAAGPGQRGQHGPGRQRGAQHVRGHQPVPLARGQAVPAQERGRRGPARVGEHHVQPAQRAVYFADQGEQLIPVGYVAADRQGPVRAAEIRGQGPERAWPAASEHHPVAGPGGRPGGGRADAPRRPGDQEDWIRH
jgi:hypothetical protein